MLADFQLPHMEEVEIVPSIVMGVFFIRLVRIERSTTTERPRHRATPRSTRRNRPMHRGTLPESDPSSLPYPGRSERHKKGSPGIEVTLYLVTNDHRSGRHKYYQILHGDGLFMVAQPCEPDQFIPVHLLPRTTTYGRLCQVGQDLPVP